MLRIDEDRAPCTRLRIQPVQVRINLAILARPERVDDPENLEGSPVHDRPHCTMLLYISSPVAAIREVSVGATTVRTETACCTEMSVHCMSRAVRPSRPDGALCVGLRDTQPSVFGS